MAVEMLPPLRKLVIIEENLLLSMANNPVLVKEFDFLKPLVGQQAARQGCGGCGNATPQRATVLTAAKQAIANMGDDRKRQLKKLLNAKQARVTYKMGNRIIERTF